MYLYRVEFSKDWITGRWGYVDRAFFELKGRETEPSRLENAWLVHYAGAANKLGSMLSERLNIQPKDFKQFGTIFEITRLSDEEVEQIKRRNNPRDYPERHRPTMWER